jgi:diphosphomevalonate decarboxylase
MGKDEGNIPKNISLSYTLWKFVTEVSMEICKNSDEFLNEFDLSSSSIERFLQHLNRIKQITNFHGYFRVKSVNNFPHSAGIASSASSFAALTICAFDAICEMQGVNMPTMEYMSSISRLGSGSSYRSFFSPWCVWEQNHAKVIDIKTSNLKHDLILVDKSVKKISSSNAHALIQTSLLAHGRTKRAEIRFYELICALNNDEWAKAYQICWEEFFDMHALFETSRPHFGYIGPKTMLVISEIREFWNEHNDGPIVTIDAGPNVHLLWRKDSSQLRDSMKEELSQKCEISFL